MKKFFVAALVLCSAVVNAAEVVVLDTRVSLLSNYRALSDASFYMDKSTGEGFVNVSVMQERQVVIHYGPSYPYPYPGPGRHFPHPYPDYRFPQTHTERIRIMEDKVRVDGLSLVGDKVVFAGAEGEIECGTLGVSRVLKVPTIFLNGNCKLSSKIVDRFGDSRVVVTLKTK